MTRNVRFAILAWVVALASLSAPAMAQVLYGSLVGTITDESGLAVPGATVTITQVETNQSRAGTTGSNGTYTFPNIAAGTYQVDVALHRVSAISSSRHRCATKRRRSCRCEAARRQSPGVCRSIGRRRDSPDRNGRGAVANDEPAD